MDRRFALLTSDDGTEIRVKGELDLATVGALEERLRRASGADEVTVDLRDCSFVDTVAARMLGEIRVINPRPQARRLLELVA